MEKLTDEEKIAELTVALEDAEHSAWVSQVMISTILDTLGVVTITKEVAQKDFTGMGIDITESEDGEALILQLKPQQEDVPDES